MKGNIHLMPISLTWVVTYDKNYFTITQLPIIINLELSKKDDNKKVEFNIINLDGIDHAKINKLGKRII